MFYVKLLVMAGLLLLTLVQLLSFGMNVFYGLSRRSTDLAPTSFVTARVVAIEKPPMEEDAGARPANEGVAVLEYRDPASGENVRKDFPRVISIGPTEVFSKNIGDEIRIEVPDPKQGSASTTETAFWSERAKNSLFFAAFLLVAAAIFRFL